MRLVGASAKIKGSLAAQNVILPAAIKSRVTRGRNINVITQRSSKSEIARALSLSHYMYQSA
jgi:hypothetical protein